MSTVEVLAQNITSCAFGGDDFDTLYITTVREGMTDEGLANLPLSGSLFSIQPNVRGLLANRFKERNIT
ncbi:SMP-30/gluconolactonase/LRE family protein [Gracilibacillus thailandensis]|uniref:SMP-30/gluconolactonase/LRE family protein n=1 Tax=Gracilibacillus thailandensis TaxID=563735 RepID=UPI00196A141C|nr:SMP-30/gluconolactonase/LRE family protein [Gracilibacillus thailandensis]